MLVEGMSQRKFVGTCGVCRSVGKLTGDVHNGIGTSDKDVCEQWQRREMFNRHRTREKMKAKRTGKKIGLYQQQSWLAVGLDQRWVANDS